MIGRVDCAAPCPIGGQSLPRRCIASMIGAASPSRSAVGRTSVRSLPVVAPISSKSARQRVVAGRARARSRAAADAVDSESPPGRRRDRSRNATRVAVESGCGHQVHHRDDRRIRARHGPVVERRDDRGSDGSSRESGAALGAAVLQHGAAASGCSSVRGTRASWHGDGCWAGMYASRRPPRSARRTRAGPITIWCNATADRGAPIVDLTRLRVPLPTAADQPWAIRPQPPATADTRRRPPPSTRRRPGSGIDASTVGERRSMSTIPPGSPHGFGEVRSRAMLRRLPVQPLSTPVDNGVDASTRPMPDRGSAMTRPRRWMSDQVEVWTAVAQLLRAQLTESVWFSTFTEVVPQVDDDHHRPRHPGPEHARPRPDPHPVPTADHRRHGRPRVRRPPLRRRSSAAPSTPTNPRPTSRRASTVDGRRSGIAAGQRSTAGSGDDALDEAGLNPRYTFETFVKGASNQFALAAALRVAETPGPQLQPAVHLRLRRSRQDPPAARDRPLRPQQLPAPRGAVRLDRDVHERVRRRDPLELDGRVCAASTARSTSC